MPVADSAAAHVDGLFRGKWFVGCHICLQFTVLLVFLRHVSVWKRVVFSFCRYRPPPGYPPDSPACVISCRHTLFPTVAFLSGLPPLPTGGGDLPGSLPELRHPLPEGKSGWSSFSLDSLPTFFFHGGELPPVTERLLQRQVGVSLFRDVLQCHDIQVASGKFQGAGRNEPVEVGRRGREVEGATGR